MALYQRKVLATGELIGDPAPLPLDLVGSLTDAQLENLTPLNPADYYIGQGFFRVADPEPPAPRWIHKAIFLLRIPAAQRIAIRAAAKTDPIVEDFLDVLYATDLVELDGTATVAGVAYLVAQTLLTADEAATLLA